MQRLRQINLTRHELYIIFLNLNLNPASDPALILSNEISFSSFEPLRTWNHEATQWGQSLSAAALARRAPAGLIPQRLSPPIYID